MNRVKVYQYKGMDISMDTSQPRKGYSIDHPDYEDQTFTLLQHAVDKIDEKTRGAQASGDHA